MQTPESPPTPQTPLTDTPRRRAILKQLRSRPSVKGSVIAFLVLLAVVMLAPFLAPQNPYDLGALDLMDGRLPPGSTSMDGFNYWLGTDSQGRDMLSAILYGLRISLTVGLAAVALATVIGSLIGLLAAYVGGFVDTVLMRIVDFILGFPTILVALVLLAMLGRGVD
jgi:peptide/nickel transport system permease protein